MIPQTGLESTPSDLTAWILVNMIRERFSAPTRDVDVSIHEFKYVSVRHYRIFADDAGRAHLEEHCLLS